MKNRKRYAILAVATLVLGLASVAGPARTHSNLSPEHVDLMTPATSRVESPADADVAVRRQATIAVSAECAYDVLADVRHWSRWDRNIARTELHDGETLTEGGRFYQLVADFEAEAEVLLAERGKSLRWRGRPPSGGGPVGVHTWTFEARPDGTTLVINDEHFHGWYLRPLGWFSDFGIGEQFDQTIGDLETEAQRRCGPQLSVRFAE